MSELAQTAYRPKRVVGRRIVQTPSGLVYPSIPEEPKKKPHGLVISDQDERDEVGRLLTKLVNVGSVRGCGMCLDPASRQILEARRDLVRFVAKQLLGSDWECEELC